MLLNATVIMRRGEMSATSEQELREVMKQNDLDKTAWRLHEAMSELVRVYQFRDRKHICYYDVSVTQCHAMGALVAHGPMSLNELAAELYLDKSTTSRLVDSLEQKGYVSRTVDPQDGRALRLESTRDGRKLYSKIEEDLVLGVKTLLKELRPEVRQEATWLVERLAAEARRRFAERGLIRDEN